MDWNQILQASVVSAIISGAFSFFTYRRQKKIDYTYDYKKYILDKRKKAYDAVEKIIMEVGGHNNYLFDEGKPNEFVKGFAFIGYGTGHFVHNFAQSVSEVVDTHFWLSKEIAGDLRILNKLLIDIIAKNHFKLYEEKDRYNAVMEYFSQIEALKQPLRQTFFKDITELDNIEKFKKEKIG